MKATRWLPVVACFVDDEESASPPIVAHVVRRTGCCCGGCVGFMVLMLLLSVMAISTQDEDFPTTDSTGFRDRDDITSLSLDAVTLVQEQKDRAEKSSRADMICEEGRDGKEECTVDALVPPNTKANRRWGLTLMFKRKDEKNLLTPAILTKLKTDIVDKITGTKDYDKFCLKNPPACTYHTCVPKASGTANQTTCDQYANAAVSAWQSECVTLGCDYSAFGANKTVSASAASCTAAGGVYTPQTCSPIMSPLNWVFPTTEAIQVSGNDSTRLLFDGQGSELSPCEANTLAGIDSTQEMFQKQMLAQQTGDDDATSKCNSMYCMCSSAATTTAEEQRLGELDIPGYNNYRSARYRRFISPKCSVAGAGADGAADGASGAAGVAALLQRAGWQ